MLHRAFSQWRDASRASDMTRLKNNAIIRQVVQDLNLLKKHYQPASTKASVVTHKAKSFGSDSTFEAFYHSRSGFNLGRGLEEQVKDSGRTQLLTPAIATPATRNGAREVHVSHVPQSSLKTPKKPLLLSDLQVR